MNPRKKSIDVTLSGIGGLKVCDPVSIFLLNWFGSGILKYMIFSSKLADLLKLLFSYFFFFCFAPRKAGAVMAYIVQVRSSNNLVRKRSSISFIISAATVMTVGSSALLR